VNPELVGITTLALTQSVTVFQQFLPPLTDVRKIDAGSDRSGMLDVRIGEIASAALVIGIGGVLSMMVRTHEPLLVATVAAIGLVGIYEYVLRCEPV
jgi:hypothetical protein